MSALETEFFNLLETSESRWTALFIEDRTWFNIEVQSFARQAQIDREEANGARTATFRRSDSNENEASGTALAVKPVDHEETWRLWATPERRRAKFEVGNELVDVVIEGSTFWSNGHGRSITNGGKALPDDVVRAARRTFLRRMKRVDARSHSPIACSQ